MMLFFINLFRSAAASSLESPNETRSAIRTESGRRCLSEILNEVQPPPVESVVELEELSGDPPDKLTLEIKDVITKSSDSDESKEASFRNYQRRKFRTPSVESLKRSSPPPLEPTVVLYLDLWPLFVNRVLFIFQESVVSSSGATCQELVSKSSIRGDLTPITSMSLWDRSMAQVSY